MVNFKIIQIMFKANNHQRASRGYKYSLGGSNMFLETICENK